MTEDDSFNEERNMDGGERHGEPNRLMAGLKIFAGLCVVGAAVSIAVYWMMNRPRAEREEPEQEARVVEVSEVNPGTHRMTVHAMGSVVPADEVGLVARVSGQITKVNPDLVPGSHLSEGEMLARVDQSDYRLALQQARANYQQAKLTARERKLAIQQRQSEVAQAEKNLTLEKAKQDVAQGEYDLLVKKGDGTEDDLALANPGTEGEQSMLDIGNPGYSGPGASISENEKALILREPQIKAARAALAAAKSGKESAEVAYENAREARKKAQSALEQAKLDYERTTIEVPFDAVVQSEQVGVGTYVSPGNPLASLVNTEQYRVELSVPVDQLRWIEAPTRPGSEGSKARIYYEAGWGQGKYR
ncbi:MAG: HlyD family efflux transporter periplasmic adaptor subunit, partial [Planctomycetota bacterium]